MRPERRGVMQRALPVGERGALDIQLVVFDGIENAQAGIRGVARHQNHLDLGAVRPSIVQRQQLAHHIERHAFFQHLVLMLDLIPAIRRQALALVHLMALIQIEQGA